MPTLKPRITVAFEPEHYEILAALSKRQGVSMSSIISDLWGMAAPVMLRVVKLLEQAEKVQEGARVGIRQAAADAEEKMLPQVRAVLNNFDLFEEAIKGHIAEVHSADSRSARADVRRPKKPPSSNTGVRSKKVNKIKG